MPLINSHELEASTDGLVYFVPAKGPDRLGTAIRKQGGERAEAELRMPRLRVGEAVVRRGYGTGCTYLIVTSAPVCDLSSADGLEAYEMALRVCLDAAEKYNLTSLTFGSWSLASAGLPALLAALVSNRVVDQWREEHKRRVLKKIVFAIHDESGYEAFKQVNGLGAKARATMEEAEQWGSEEVWRG